MEGTTWLDKHLSKELNTAHGRLYPVPSVLVRAAITFQCLCAICAVLPAA